MQRKKNAAEFLFEAAKQVNDKADAVVDVATGLGIFDGVLYGWVNKFKKSDEAHSGNLKALHA